MNLVQERLWDPVQVARDLDIPHVFTPCYIALDRDRTTGAINETDSSGNPIGAMARLLVVAAMEGIDPDEIRAEQEEVEMHDSYDALQAIKNRLLRQTNGAEAFARLRTRFRSQDSSLPSLVYEDTLPFMAALRQHQPPHGVYTAGQNPVWQGDKVFGDGYTGYTNIMPMLEVIQPDGSVKQLSPPKGPTIRSLRGALGTYDSLGIDPAGKPVAVFSAHEAILIDDKNASAQGMPHKTSRSYIVRRPGHKVSDRQRGPLPANASEIPQLPDNEWVRARSAVTDCAPISKFVPLSLEQVS